MVMLLSKCSVKFEVKMLKLARSLSHVCNLKPFKETKWMMPNGNPTGIYIYNCVADQKVPLILNDPNIATWYSCGPTVYDSAHIGHASCYVKLDIVQRILKSFFNIKLITAMGVTDIDDKIIQKAKDTNKDFKTIAKQYEHEFWCDMSNLNIERPFIITRVSEHISCIENFVKKLIENGSAYIGSDSSVYFDTSKFQSYGKLQKMQDSGEVINSDKKDKMDFALWKGHKSGEPYWSVSWGKGRPGWHIECSAMVSRLFGSQLDFHAGGIDLQFPHHENEEAQSCAFHNTKQWANYWIHVGHLHVKGDDTKMSKSLQNTISIPKLLDSYSADTFRMACLMSNYRYPIEYCDEVMKTAEDVINKLKFFLRDALIYVNNNTVQSTDYKDSMLNNLQEIEEKNLEALKSDFDTSTCINNLLKLVSRTQKLIKLDTEYYPVPILLTVNYITNVLNSFGMRLQDSSHDSISSFLIDTLVEFRHIVRMNALAKKDKELLSSCDMVRDKMMSFKVQINDANKTPTWVTTK